MQKSLCQLSQDLGTSTHPEDVIDQKTTKQNGGNFQTGQAKVAQHKDCSADIQHCGRKTTQTSRAKNKKQNYNSYEWKRERDRTGRAERVI